MRALAADAALRARLGTAQNATLKGTLSAARYIWRWRGLLEDVGVLPSSCGFSLADWTPVDAGLVQRVLLYPPPPFGRFSGCLFFRCHYCVHRKPPSGAMKSLVCGRLHFHSTVACSDRMYPPQCMRPSLPLKKNRSCVFLFVRLLA